MAKRIVILGAGESGAGAAVLAKKQGFDTFVSDMSAIKDKYKAMLDERGIEWEEGKHKPGHSQRSTHYSEIDSVRYAHHFRN